MAIDKVKQRERWGRNKSSERSKKREAAQRRRVCPAYETAVLFERDWRSTNGREGFYRWKEHGAYFWGGRAERAFKFAVDVWAAERLVEAEHGRGKATPTRTRDKLKQLGWTSGYTDGSMRKMIYKARERIKVMETIGEPQLGYSVHDVFWPRFFPLTCWHEIFAVVTNGCTKCRCGRWMAHNAPSEIRSLFRSSASICSTPSACK